MKKRIFSIFLSVVMLLGMLPVGALPAFAEASGWYTHEVHGTYGYVKSGNGFCFC